MAGTLWDTAKILSINPWDDNDLIDYLCVWISDLGVDRTYLCTNLLLSRYASAVLSW